MTRREITPEHVAKIAASLDHYIQGRRARGIPRDGLKRQKRYILVQLPKRDRSIRLTEAEARDRLTAALARHNLPPTLANEAIGQWKRGTYMIYTTYTRTLK